MREALVQIRREKKQAAERAAAANAEMHRDSIICRRTGKKPNRDLVKKYMYHYDRVGALNIELRKLDPELPPLDWAEQEARSQDSASSNNGGFFTPKHPNRYTKQSTPQGTSVANRYSPLDESAKNPGANQGF